MRQPLSESQWRWRFDSDQSVRQRKAVSLFVRHRTPYLRPGNGTNTIASSFLLRRMTAFPNHRPKPKGKVMIWYILSAVVAVIGIIAIIASTKPDQWTVQRQQAIPGAPAKVFPYMDDLRKFN